MNETDELMSRQDVLALLATQRYGTLSATGATAGSLEVTPIAFSHHADFRVVVRVPRGSEHEEHLWVSSRAAFTVVVPKRHVAVSFNYATLHHLTSFSIKVGALLDAYFTKLQVPFESADNGNHNYFVLRPKAVQVVDCRTSQLLAEHDGC